MRYPIQKPRRSKYGSHKITVDGQVFDSQKEARRYGELKLLLAAGKISELRTQVLYELIPTQYETVERYGKGGKRLKDGLKVVERACDYIADFVYVEDGKTVVEDVKSVATRKKESYIIKRKLMLYLKHIKLKEV
jgi:hypothetical protein